MMTMFYSVDPIMGRWFLSLYLAGMAAMVIVLQCKSEKAIYGILDGLIAGAVLVLGVALSHHLQASQSFLSVTGYRFGHSLVSAVQVGTILSAGGLIWALRNMHGSWFKRLDITVFIALISGSALTMSRSTIVALVIGIILLLIRRTRTKELLKSLIIIALISSAVSYFVFIYQPQVARSRFVVPTSQQNRMGIWEAAYEMFLSEPVGGLGVGSWIAIYPEYADEIRGISRTISDAHNIFLQVIVETGTIGFIMLLVFYLGVAKSAIISKKAHSISLLSFVLIIAMFNNLKLVAPYLLLGLTILFSHEEADFNGEPKVE
jgi:O-antigen ligase